MRKRIWSIAVLLFCLIFTIAIAADEIIITDKSESFTAQMTVSLTVKNGFTVTVKCSEHGAYVYDEKSYTAENAFDVEKGEGFSITAKPDEGCYLAKVTSSTGENVTCEGNVITLSSVNEDVTLLLEFALTPAPTATATATAANTATATASATATPTATVTSAPTAAIASPVPIAKPTPVPTADTTAKPTKAPVAPTATPAPKGNPLVISSANESLAAGQFVLLTANKEVAWVSSDSKVAQVDHDGHVVAISQGTAEIKAVSVDSAETAACKVSVSKAAFTIKAPKKALTFVEQDVGQTLKLKPKTNGKVKYKSSDKSIAKVTNKGVITPLRPGYVTITVTNKGKTAYITLCVNDVPIKLNKSAKTIKAGKQWKLVPTQGKKAKGITYKFLSSDTKVAKVKKNGVIKAVRKGECLITVTSSTGQTATCKITVK